MNKKYPIVIAAIVIVIGISLSISDTIPTQTEPKNTNSGGSTDQNLPITTPVTHGRNLSVDLTENIGVKSMP